MTPAVVFVTAIAPLATDMYVPAFPQVATDLGASATQVQLTLTTFFAGMALGQLIGAVLLQLSGWRLSFHAVAVLAGGDGARGRGAGDAAAGPSPRWRDARVRGGRPAGSRAAPLRRIPARLRFGDGRAGCSSGPGDERTG